MNILSLLNRNKTLRNIGIYMFSTSLNQAVPFLLLPLLTIYLSPGDYGYINSFSAILVLSNAIVGGGIVNNIAKYYFNKDQQYMKKMMGNLYFLLLCISLLAFVITLIITRFVNITFIPPALFIAIPFISFFFISFEFLKETKKLRKQASKFALFTFSEMAFNISISLILIIALLWNWKGRVSGITFSYITFGIFAILYFLYKNEIKFSIDKKMIKSILTLSIPLLPSVVSIMIIRKSGVLFVDAFLGKNEAGLYGIALNLSTLILFISMPFVNVWIPYIYKKLSKINQNTFRDLRGSLFIFTCFIFSVCLIFSLISGVILKIMTTDAFLPAKVFIPWLAFGFAFWALYSMYMPFYIHYEKQKYLAIIAVSSAVFNVITNYILILKIGATGIAISFFISNFFTFLFVFFWVRTFIKLPVFPDFKRIGLIFKDLTK